MHQHFPGYYFIFPTYCCSALNVSVEMLLPLCGLYRLQEKKELRWGRWFGWMDYIAQEVVGMQKEISSGKWKSVMWTLRMIMLCNGDARRRSWCWMMMVLRGHKEIQIMCSHYNVPHWCEPLMVKQKIHNICGSWWGTQVKIKEYIYAVKSNRISYVKIIVSFYFTWKTLERFNSSQTKFFY